MGPQRDPITGRFIQKSNMSTDPDNETPSPEDSYDTNHPTPPATAPRVVQQAEQTTPTPVATTSHNEMADSESGTGSSGGAPSGGPLSDLDKRLRLAEIEQELLRMKLCLAEINQGNMNSNPVQGSIQIAYDKVADFRNEIMAKNIKTTFKLDGSSNYDSWRDEALTQALSIEAKGILKYKQLTCPDTITNDDDKRIWEIKQKAVFDMLLTGLKPEIRKTIKSQEIIEILLRSGKQ